MTSFLHNKINQRGPNRGSQPDFLREAKYVIITHFKLVFFNSFQIDYSNFVEFEPCQRSLTIPKKKKLKIALLNNKVVVDNHFFTMARILSLEIIKDRALYLKIQIMKCDTHYIDLLK